ncbi:hypothetical protein CEXT_595941 [Caerostris extrusa]|uniref:Uncharacterized protein n=1 Tax=Caerostris extrusa TaxID=172846 RepID=A0AAV4Y2J9_CAEEX|nr:hypothetical protein CEXT_595941 [Caerostris extrusa]
MAPICINIAADELVAAAFSFSPLLNSQKERLGELPTYKLQAGGKKRAIIILVTNCSRRSVSVWNNKEVILTSFASATWMKLQVANKTVFSPFCSMNMPENYSEIKL